MNGFDMMMYEMGMQKIQESLENAEKKRTAHMLKVQENPETDKCFTRRIVNLTSTSFSRR